MMLSEAIVIKINALWKSASGLLRYDKPVLPMFFKSNGDPAFVSDDDRLPTSSVIESLPEGLATSAKQDTSNTHLSNILTAVNEQIAITSATLGDVADSSATDASSSWSVIALLKGMWTKLAAVVLSQDISHATLPQMVAVTASSSQSAAIHANTKRIKVTAVENDIYIKFGTTASPATAAVGGAGCLYLIDGMSTDWLTVAATTQVAVIARVAGGYANIQEIL
jgi:hypothetical protein